MRGSIRKRGLTYTALWWLIDADGKRHQQSKAGFERKKDAQAFLSRTLTAIADSVYVEPSKLTLHRFVVDEWLPAVQASLRETTFHSYRRELTAHVLPRLGGVRLQQLGPEHLNRLYAELLADGRANGSGGLSPAPCGTCTQSCGGL